ncbi:PTS sugar transporter subunit IIA [Nitrosovibrio tenuis]|uniref:PTS system, ascorbate-specific IIA component n=1 Tax=Nitrosovibrio tenuis TaxID=1233 RepID=A0A1H7RHU9_9PROT|nr:PTS fructose transporter subunit IIA [Nitrosovibrio tenuis]SEL59762.1 PTS system, ascorbate-specific IIA component [Nitrosovibrio tenuis]
MIGILIVSHGNLGDSLIHCANHVMGDNSRHLTGLSITTQDDPDKAVGKALGLIKQLDQGDGVLILCDICGATPCNIASRLISPGRVECLAGVNLPMLVRALTYRTESLAVAAEKALMGGRDGVIRLFSP